MLSWLRVPVRPCQARISALSNDAEGLARTASGWERVNGLHLEPERVRCLGCKGAGEPMDATCLVRGCCLEKGLASCASCESFPCAKVEEKMVSRASVEARMGSTLDEDAYGSYVLPYEGGARLEEEKKRRAGKRTPGTRTTDR